LIRLSQKKHLNRLRKKEKETRKRKVSLRNRGKKQNFCLQKKTKRKEKPMEKMLLNPRIENKNKMTNN
jgi:hypothetical protein